MPVLARGSLLAELGVPRRGAIAVGRVEEGCVGGVGVDVLGRHRGLVGGHVIGGHGAARGLLCLVVCVGVGVKRAWQAVQDGL